MLLGRGDNPAKKSVTLNIIVEVSDGICCSIHPMGISFITGILTYEDSPHAK
jgi:hypothetical protein